MSDLSPECTPKQTSADALEFMGLRPMIGWVDLLLPALSAPPLCQPFPNGLLDRVRQLYLVLRCSHLDVPDDVLVHDHQHLLLPCPKEVDPDEDDGGKTIGSKRRRRKKS
jgi:hypothetical protein